MKRNVEKKLAKVEEKPFNPEESQQILLPQNQQSSSGGLKQLGRGSLSKGNGQKDGKMMQFQNMEQDYESQFLMLADLIDIGSEHLENAEEHFNDITFDVFNFSTLFQENIAFQFMVHKIFLKYDFYKKYSITVDTCFNFSREMANGYFKENAHHNQYHIIDSLQAMHYLMHVGNLRE